ncbi:hypothetical protein GLYMA_06G168100v4 [Glycine max]|nr:hypothetical protein GLYMA_06G168100v4 [Glycine max]
MAAISNISLQFPGNLTDAKKDNNVLRLSFCSPRNTTNMSSEKRRFLSRLLYKQGNWQMIQVQQMKLLLPACVEGLWRETALNHVTSSGIGGEGFGATREMSLRKLIWVVTRIQVQVQRYNKWGDEIEVDTWVDAAGKNGMRRDWIIRDHYTKEIITRATSTWVIMNRQTRRLSKIPEEVKQELLPFYLNRLAVPTEETDCEKIDKLTDETAQIRILSGLAPRWNDMDANQHVNNVKYIGWILESVPIEVLEHYNMTSMTLEFRRECTQSNLLESMTCPTARVMESNNNSKNRKPDMQYTHLLRLQQDKADVVRARTEWNFKQKHQ